MGLFSVDSFHSLGVDLLERITSFVTRYLNDLVKPPWDNISVSTLWAIPLCSTAVDPSCTGSAEILSYTGVNWRTSLMGRMVTTHEACLTLN